MPPITATLPSGNPFGAAPTIMTQGYGVGSHSPAETWGAIDLAVAGAPSATTGATLYATHDGTVTATPNSWPEGNHVWITNDEYRTGYAHLETITVSSGHAVRRGDPIGTAGSTGMSSGPRLDYQVWQTVDGRWVNRNPLDYHPRPNERSNDADIGVAHHRTISLFFEDGRVV